MSRFFIALAVTDILLLFMLVRLPVRAHWLSKIVAIVLVLGLSFLAWGSRDDGAGWPIAQPLPENTEHVACVVVEPTRGDAGAIYLWAIPLVIEHGVLSYRPEVGEPRAYEEPYDRSLHEACEKAKKKIASGERVTIKKKKAGVGGRRGRIGEGRYMPYVLPSVNLPSKEGSP